VWCPHLTGPLDAGTSVALPRRPIPELYTKSLRQRVRHVTFASNPCRVRYFTQEIVLFREDLLKKMQRHLAVPLVLDDPSVPDITEQLVESLLDQVSPHELVISADGPQCASCCTVGASVPAASACEARLLGAGLHAEALSAAAPGKQSCHKPTILVLTPTYRLVHA
jgi:hypothetical protein